MKKESQLWIAFLAALIGIPLAMTIWSVATGKIEEERSKANQVEQADPADR